MAACKSVIVFCPNGHRQTVKVTPTTAIIQITEEVCKKQGFPSHEYSLKHQRSVLDSTIPIRYSGLSNNAHLELVPSLKSKKDAKSTVALQLLSGERLVKDFPSTSTLWDVLHHWDSQEDSSHHGKVIQPCAENGEEKKVHPVCVYMTQELSGENQLKKTTLHSLGLTGRQAIIRLLHREYSDQDTNTEMSDLPVDSKGSAAEQPKNETKITDNDTKKVNSNAPPDTTAETTATLKSTHPETSSRPQTQTGSAPIEATRKLKNQPAEEHLRGADTGVMESKRPRIKSPPKAALADFKFPQNTAGLDLSQRHESSQSGRQRSNSPCDRNPVIFSEEDSTLVNSEQSDDLPDSFFDVTVDDVRKMLEGLKSERNKADCTPLMTKAMREVQKELEIDRYDKVVIRIKFPDRYILQGFFRPREKVSALVEFVKPYLENPQSKFYLYTSPPRCVLNQPEVTLFNAELCPASVVYFGSSEHQEHFLSEAHRMSVSSAFDAARNVAESGVMSNVAPIHRVNVINSAAGQQSEYAEHAAGTQSPASGRSISNKNVPKWFKAGGKS